MKKTEENRYPHSATLFKFCKEALELRYEGNVKVIDQDVGAILGYDPADCSHWKKGKKNIRALSTIRSIADHLNVDERLLIDVASGRVGLEEAVFEFKGYGAFALQGRHLENLKKEYFKNPSKWQPEESKFSFEELFDTNRPSVAKVAQVILEKGKFVEAPIYLPEIVQMYPNFKTVMDPNLADAVSVTYEGEGVNTIATVKHRSQEMRPYLRFLVAREFFKYLSKAGFDFMKEFAKTPAEILDIQANMFASMLLIPSAMLKKEVERIDSSFDIVVQLSEIFWVSKALMNQRLRDYMENLS